MIDVAAVTDLKCKQLYYVILEKFYILPDISSFCFYTKQRSWMATSRVIYLYL